MKHCILALLALAATALAQGEPFRPAFHFTPQKNWMNDPNGMVFFEGEWHLFYQYNPHGNTWGHMSWGHAVSRDLVRWEHLPLALAEEDGVMIFSGSAVVDWKNTSGFGRDGKPPLVAIYTGHQKGRQDQRLAFSNDRGRTWTKFAGNPVLDLKMADFRDPKVFWHEATARWVMVVALSLEKKVHFYTSPNLKEWKYAGEFGPAGGTDGIWECPDLFPLAIEGGGTKWTLIVNLNPGGPAGGSGCQYFVGEFDGAKFTPEPLPASLAEFVPDGKVLADFENGYAGWKAEGDAFGDAPAAGMLPGQQPVSGFRGKGLVNSFRNGDKAQGTLTSPPFEITAGHISFLIGGGSHAETRVDLRVDGKVVRTATGREMERLAWQSWDVRELRGRRAELQVVDMHSGGWGHINLDHVILADEPARPAADGALWADFGADFYAAVSWSDVPAGDGRRVWLAWMSNWQYAEKVPTHPWRSAMTVPRTLALRKTPAGLRLVQQPVAELASLREGARKFPGGTLAAANEWLQAERDLPPLLDIEIALTGITAKSTCTLQLHTGPDEATAVILSGTRLAVDRTRSGRTEFQTAFPARHEAPLRVTDGRVTLRLLVDTSSLEIFAQDGETVLTELILPTAGPRRLSFAHEGDTPAVGAITIHALKPGR
jgi:sucrose-6-phosphate hydrolase SacC (GH32 family)